MYAAVAFALLAAGALGSPIPSIEVEPRLQPCEQDFKYTVTSETVIQNPPALVTGFECTSLTSATCSITHSATYTSGTSISAAGGLTGLLKLSEIFTAGANAGFTYSWDTSNAVGSTAGVDCPAGGFTCGLQAVASMVKTVGTVVEGQTGNCNRSPPSGPQAFTALAPQKVSGVPADQSAVIDFQACYTTCSGAQCAAAKQQGLPACPSA